MGDYNTAQTMTQKFIIDVAKKQEEFILSIFEKQKGFKSIEESKNFIEVRRMVREGEYIGTDYLFKDKVILTVFPSKFTEENGKYKSTVSYQEYK